MAKAKDSVKQNVRTSNLRKSASDEARRLLQAASEGRLNERAVLTDFDGKDREVLEAVNGIMDAMVRPLTEVKQAMQRLVVNDYSAALQGTYVGMFAELTEATNLAQSRMKHTVGILGNFAAGDYAKDLDELKKVKQRSENDTLVPALIQAMETIDNLQKEMGGLTEAALQGHLSERGKAEHFHGTYAGIVKGINETLDAVVGPLMVSAKYVDQISKGDIPAKITDTYKGDFNEIKNNLNACIDAVGAMVADGVLLVNSSLEGKLATRADASKHQGDFRKIIQGVNDMLDAVVGPLTMSAKCMDEISKGTIPPKITDNYKGDFNEIKNNLNVCIDAINAMMADGVLLVNSSLEGKLATRADASKHQGDFRKIIQGVNDMLDAVVGPLTVSAKYVDQISKGDIPAKITDTYKGDFNEIKNNLNACIDAVNAMVADGVLLVNSSLEGKLATRADASKHQGDYRKIIQGINEMLDAVVGPLTVSAKYVDQISKGDIPAKITDTYKGDFNEIKNNLNACIDAVNAMVADGVLLVNSSLEGKLATRADASKHQGDYRKIVQGINAMLDAVVGPLTVSAKYVDQISKGDIPAKITDTYKGDFNEIKNNLNACIDAVNAMAADTNTLIKASLDGKLSTRADASKHQGDYRKIVQGVNEMLDAVVGPLTVSAKYVDQISKGDIPA